MSKNDYRDSYFRQQQARRRGPRKPKPKPVTVVVRQSPLEPAEYATYMRSSHWARRKAAYFQTHDRSCVVCGIEDRIHLHHLTYERLGCELDDDLRPLCEKHHAAAHEHHRLFGGTLQEATLRFIERMHAT